jgi:ADP-heptose:LPS heptosyltransferase
MNVAAMRLVDKWSGVPACALLTVMRRVGDLFAPRRPVAEPKRIAAIKLAEQGATVVAYPALNLAAEKVGRENLFFVVFTQNRFIVDLLEIVPPENVIAIRTDNAFQTLCDTVRAVLRMRREKIDATVDCEFFARSTAMLSYLSGARIRVGFHAFYGEASYRGDLMTHRIIFNATLHASEIFHFLFDAIWCDQSQLPTCDLMRHKSGQLPNFKSEPATLAKVDTLLQSALGVETVPPVILLNANRGDFLPLRSWPPERYVELAKRLLDEHEDLAVVFTGAPDEEAGAQELVDQVSSARCVNFAGRTTLDELFALYSRSEIMVTNDSGPAHYATVTPIDIITLFGPETPEVFGAINPRSHLVWKDIVCSPCVNAFNDRQSPCKSNVCMQRISVSEVFELACRIFISRGTTGARRVQKETT